MVEVAIAICEVSRDQFLIEECEVTLNTQDGRRGVCVDNFCGVSDEDRLAKELAVARNEAIACWAESLRDTMSGARGLEAALASTAPVAPAAIRPELTTFAERLYRMPLPQALARLADAAPAPDGGSAR